MSAQVTHRLNLNRLSVEEKKDLLKKTYEKTSYFQQLFGKDEASLDCRQYSELFRQEIQRLLIEKNIVTQIMPLEKLHECLSDDMIAYNFNDGVNKVTTFFYETDEKFIDLYYQFIGFLRENFLKEPFFFQSTPTIRIHCPNGLNSHHYPRYHSDLCYGHPPEEFNIWFPLTQMLSGHSFRAMPVKASKQMMEQFEYDASKLVEHAIHDKDFTRHCDALSTPVTTEFGSMIAFDSRCIHTAEPLETHTRISIDIRILPLSQYEKMNIEYQGSGRRKILFTPGHCYQEKNSDKITIKEFSQ